MSAAARAQAVRSATLQLITSQRVPACVMAFNLSEARLFKDQCEALAKVRSYSGARSLAEYFAPLYGVKVEQLDPEPPAV